MNHENISFELIGSFKWTKRALVLKGDDYNQGKAHWLAVTISFSLLNLTCNSGVRSAKQVVLISVFLFLDVTG